MRKAGLPVCRLRLQVFTATRTPQTGLIVTLKGSPHFARAPLCRTSCFRRARQPLRDAAPVLSIKPGNTPHPEAGTALVMGIPPLYGRGTRRATALQARCGVLAGHPRRLRRRAAIRPGWGKGDARNGGMGAFRSTEPGTLPASDHRKPTLAGKVELPSGRLNRVDFGAQRAAVGGAVALARLRLVTFLVTGRPGFQPVAPKPGKPETSQDKAKQPVFAGG
jgi:hypothetical protein